MCQLVDADVEVCIGQEAFITFDCNARWGPRSLLLEQLRQRQFLRKVRVCVIPVRHRRCPFVSMTMKSNLPDQARFISCHLVKNALKMVDESGYSLVVKMQCGINRLYQDLVVGLNHERQWITGTADQFKVEFRKFFLGRRIHAYIRNAFKHEEMIE